MRTKLGIALVVLGGVMFLGSIAYAVTADILRAHILMTLFASGFGGAFVVLFGMALITWDEDNHG